MTHKARAESDLPWEYEDQKTLVVEIRVKQNQVLI